MQGGYDGTHFLANVEVYDPVKDVWEDGIPLTSGRSGLASAVIYQPSCPQNYSQDCIANVSSNREYDDEKKPPDNNDDDADITSRGTGSSYHLNCSSNFFSGHSGGVNDDVEELINCNEIRKESSTGLVHMMTQINARCKRLCNNKESSIVKKNKLEPEYNEGEFLIHMMKEINVKFREHCANQEPNSTKRLQLEQEYDEGHVLKLARMHLKCSKHSSCPLQTLKRRFRHFLSNRKQKKAAEKLCKSTGM